MLENSQNFNKITVSNVLTEQCFTYTFDMLVAAAS